MLYAKRNSNKDIIQMYIHLLNELLKGIDDDEIKMIFTTLYDDTKGIINKTKTYYNIENRETVLLISFLVEKHSDYFVEIDEPSLDDANLSELKDYLQEAALAF